MKKYESNPFTLSFGSSPYEYIPRINEVQNIVTNLFSSTPSTHCYIITGVRGSGKTVTLTTVANKISEDDKWIVVELNPEDDMREALAAKLYTTGKIKRFFTEKDFSFSFQGFSFSITGKNPILNIDDLLDKMFAHLNKMGEKVLVVVDEMSNNTYARQFSLSFQILIRKNYPLFLVATGLYENISSLENEKNMTFLIRAQKIYMSPLNLLAISKSYSQLLSMDEKEARKAAKETKGYAFAFQLLGYLLYENNKTKLDEKLLTTFDVYMEEYVYSKIWALLSEVEKKIAIAFDSNKDVNTSLILEKTGYTKEYLSKYRDRLIKKGIIYSRERGKMCFALPRFKEFIDSTLLFE